MKRLICTAAVLLALCVPAHGADMLPADIRHGLSLVPDCLVERFYAEGREIVVSDGPIVINGISRPYNCLGFFQAGGNIYVNHYWDYSASAYERVLLHEFGHYLEYSTRPAGWTEPPPKEEREWFADSFAAYILRPEELRAGAPADYADIERCLHEMKSDLEVSTHE